MAKRRPIYARADDPAPMTPTDRDRRIIDWVYKFRFLTREQVQKLEFTPGGETRCRHRLRLLYDHGYLTRVFPHMLAAYGRRPFYYALDERGGRFLADDYGIPRKELDWSPRDNEATDPFLAHTNAAADFRVHVILACRQAGYEQEWIDERELKAAEMRDYVTVSGKKMAVIPDGFFTVRLPTGHRARFALELDRGTMDVARWKRKIQAYVEYLRPGEGNTPSLFQQRFGTKAVRILTVAADVRRARDEEDRQAKILARVADLKRWTEEADGRTSYWFAPVQALSPETVFEAPIWQVATRDGLTPLINP